MSDVKLQFDFVQNQMTLQENYKCKQNDTANQGKVLGYIVLKHFKAY